MTFGQRIKMLRQERGLSQEELGRLVGVSSRVIGYYEADERFPKNRDTLIAFASAFQVSLDYLLDNPVRSDNTCPSRFCYMKSMNSEQRSAVNQFIGYLRYRERTEAAEAEDADQLSRKYAGSNLSSELIEMIENWDEDPDAAENAQEGPEAASEAEEEEIPAAVPESPSEGDLSVSGAMPEETAPAVPAEPAPEEDAVEIDELPGLEGAPSFFDELPAEPSVFAPEPAREPEPIWEPVPEPEAVADPEEDFARRASTENMNRFFDSEFFVDEFFS